MKAISHNMIQAPGPARATYLVAFFLTVGCARPSVDLDMEPARPDAGSIATRVEDAYARLSTSEAGRLMLKTIEAHGGLAAWYENGPLVLRYAYDEKDGLFADTRLLVDTWRARAHHRLAEKDAVRFGWDGSLAWRYPPGAELPVNARYWALAPYYFLAIPFVLTDSGIILTVDEPVIFDQRKHHAVRVMFEPGTGDSPDDYYVVMIDQSSYRVSAVRYIISYPGLFPNGGYYPESVMIRTGDTLVGGIPFPDELQFYRWEDDAPGRRLATALLSELAFDTTLTHASFQLPDGAEILEGY